MRDHETVILAKATCMASALRQAKKKKFLLSFFFFMKVGVI